MYIIIIIIIYIYIYIYKSTDLLYLHLFCTFKLFLLTSCVCMCPGSLPSHVPQVLINREPLRHLNFDIELLGDCDIIVSELCHHLGGHFSKLCSTPSPATEITTDDVTLLPASATVSDSNVATIPADSASAATATKHAVDNVADVGLPSATDSVPLSGGSLTFWSDVVSAASGHVADSVGDVSLPVATVSATVLDSDSSASQATILSVEVHVDTVGSSGAGSETAVNSANIGEGHSGNVEDSSPKTKAVNWASLLKRMHC